MRKLWLIGIFGFLGLLFWQLWAKEPYFYYSAHDYFRQAQEALQGDNAKALGLAQKAHQKDPHNWDYADFLAWRLLGGQDTPRRPWTCFARSGPPDRLPPPSGVRSWPWSSWRNGLKPCNCWRPI